MQISATTFRKGMVGCESCEYRIISHARSKATLFVNAEKISSRKLCIYRLFPIYEKFVYCHFIGSRRRYSPTIYRNRQAPGHLLIFECLL
jgi:hypothetical protein